MSQKTGQERRKAMSRKKHSLSTKLSIDIILLAIPVFILALGILFLQSRHFIHQEAEERSVSVLNTTIQHVRSYMSTIETATNANTWLIEENFNPDSLLSVSRRIVILNHAVDGCSINAEPDMFPQYGRFFSVYSSNRGDTVISVRETDYDYLDKVWYRAPIDSAKACWVDPFYEYTEGTLNLNEATANYCKPIYLDGGKIAGVISTELSYRKLAEAIYTVDYPYPNAYFVLLGNDGRYLIHPDSTEMFRKTIFTDADSMQDSDIIALGNEMTAGKQGVTHVNIDGRKCHVCYSPVPGTNWSLALICPTGDILKNYHQLTYIITAIIFLGLGIILVLCHRSVKQAISPLYGLLKMSQYIIEGQYDKTIPYTKRKDEIGQLQNSSATMQRALQDHVSNIQKTTEEIKKNNEELAVATQMTEEAVTQKTTFIENVMHQLRTPLNIIMGFAQVLRDGILPADDSTESQKTLSQEEVANITSMMKHNSAHLNRMVLMLFDSSDTGLSEELKIHKNDEVFCNALCKEAIAFTKERFPHIEIHFKTGLPDNVSVKTSHLYLMRTLRELLYNSAKYSDGKHISLYVTPAESSVCFIFEDVGPGLPQGFEDKIFKPFVKNDHLSEGLGLGLPLTKRHILSLGGNLTYDASYKNGCRFIVSVPK